MKPYQDDQPIGGVHMPLSRAATLAAAEIVKMRRIVEVTFGIMMRFVNQFSTNK